MWLFKRSTQTNCGERFYNDNPLLSDMVIPNCEVGKLHKHYIITRNYK